MTTGGSTSLQRRLVLMTTLVVGFLVLAALVMTLVLSEAHAATERRTALGRATLHASQLEMAVIDQETALRGYLISGDEVFLEPWRAASGAWPDLYAAVRADAAVADDPARARAGVEEVARLHGRWLTEVAAPEMSTATLDLDAAQRREASGRGKQLVDGMRTQLTGLASRAQTSRDAALAHEETQRRTVLWTALALALSLALLVGVVVVATRRLVMAPLRALGAAARGVADGERQRAVAVRGPREIAAVADDVEAMRGELINRIVEQDRLIEALGQQGPAVSTLRAMLALPVPPELPGLVVSGRCLAGEGVLTGDWYDVVPLDDGRVAITLGDVAGHGTAPAVTALAVKHALAGALVSGQPPEVAVASAVTVFGLPAGGIELPALASAFVAVLDPPAGVLTYVNAGHPAALLWIPQALRPRELEPTGPVLCQLTGDATWQRGSCPFPAAATLAVYTDGLVEARRAGTLDEYGERRLEHILSRLLRGRADHTGAAPPEERIITAVFTDVLDHAGVIGDDATLLLARHDPSRVDLVAAGLTPLWSDG